MLWIIQRAAVPYRVLCSWSQKFPGNGRNGDRAISYLYKWDASNWAELPAKFRFWYNASTEDIVEFMDQKHLDKVRTDQQFRSGRYNKLGPDLAAATFIVYRGGRVKFEHIPRWTKQTSGKKDALPNKRDNSYHLEGIDASNMKLLSVGLDNLKDLKHFKYLKLSSINYLNDWYLAKLVRFSDTLEFLDISNNPGVTDEGLASLYKLRNLKCVNITNCTGIRNAEVVCTYLTELNPELVLVGVDSLPSAKESLQEREHKERRYLNLGKPFDLLETNTDTKTEDLRNVDVECADGESAETKKEVHTETFSENRETTQTAVKA